MSALASILGEALSHLTSIWHMAHTSLSFLSHTSEVSTLTWILRVMQDDTGVYSPNLQARLRYNVLCLTIWLFNHPIHNHRRPPPGFSSWNNWIQMQKMEWDRGWQQTHLTPSQTLKVLAHLSDEVGEKSQINFSFPPPYNRVLVNCELRCCHPGQRSCCFPLTLPPWEHPCMLSSIKQEKNLPGDRRVRWEVLASPDSHSFSLLL